MKTCELTGVLLDYWVAMADVVHVDGIRDGEVIAGETPNRYVYAPSTNWAQGGPIIDENDITVSSGLRFAPFHACIGHSIYVDNDWTSGDTYLIAAMRAYVASKYGDTVPNDLPA